MTDSGVHHSGLLPSLRLGVALVIAPFAFVNQDEDRIPSALVR